MLNTKRWSMLLVLIAACTVSAYAQASRIDGKWDISANSPHGKLTLELDIKQEGTAITGTLVNFRNEKQPIKGEFKKDALTLETTSGDEIAMTGTLKADGTLAGALSTAMGDVNWTAVRAKKTK